MRRFTMLLLVGCLLLPGAALGDTLSRKEATEMAGAFFEELCGVDAEDVFAAREFNVERLRVYVPGVGYPPDSGWCWWFSFKDEKLPAAASVSIHEESGEILDWYYTDREARASYNHMFPTEEQVQLETAQKMVRQYFEACTGFAVDSLDDAVSITANFGMSDSWNDSHHIGEHEPVQSWCVSLYYSPEEQDAYWYANLIIHADTGEIMCQICTEHRRSDPGFYQIIDLSRKKP